MVEPSATVEVAAEHIAQPMDDYTVVVVPGYTMVVQLLAAVVKTTAVLQIVAKVVQGRTTMEEVVCMVPVLLVALLATVLAMSRVPPFSQSMNRMSFLGANHKRGSPFHHVLLSDIIYSTSSLLW